MSGTHKSGGGMWSSYDRRAYPREQISFPRNLFYIDLGGSKTGTVLNISEGGLAVQAIANSIDDFWPQIRFKFSKSETWVETRGRVVWANGSRDMAGLEFISLSDEGRDQIREWLAEIHTPQSDVTAEEAFQLLQATNSADPSISPASHHADDGEFCSTELGSFAQPARSSVPKNLGLESDQDLSDRKTRSRIGLLLGLSIAGLVLFFLARRVNSLWIGRQEPRDKTVAEATQLPVGKPAASEVSAPVTASAEPVVPSKQAPRFVLPTATMSHEENADALAHTLQQRNFPAFVFKSHFDDFYRVYVGPYHVRDSAMNIDRELARQGFTAILRSWSPPK